MQLQEIVGIPIEEPIQYCGRVQTQNAQNEN